MYPTKLAAALTGASIGQLSYWRRSNDGAEPLLVPNFGTGPRALSSSEDLVALRMCVRLRRETSLQKVRRAVDKLRELAPESHLSAHRMESAGRTIVWLTEEGDFVDLVEHPGQPGFPVVMEEIFGPYTANGRSVPALHTPGDGLSVDREVRNGYPVVAGTRIPYDTIAGLANDGVAPAEILDWYPDATVLAINGALNLTRLVERQEPAA